MHRLIGALSPLIIAASGLAQPESQPAELPLVTVTADDSIIDRSCRIAISDVIADANGDGVIHVRADGITLLFEPGATLDGAPRRATPDTFSGVGIRVDGRKHVTIRGARIVNYKVGILASGCDGLVIDDAAIEDLWRQSLKSTPQAEDSSDWLWPHANDQNEWLTNYGAGVYIEDASGVEVRGLVVSASQNGLILDGVNDSKVYDCDCSFNSGWGLAMWRSSRNLVSRNAFDFCIRGYSHGVYNRGQDSAGILVFEQCSSNVFVENSATHCGDGFFAFAGREALGEVPAPDGNYSERGCNNNVIVGNDFSYAAAHGLELTFSFGNTISNNRFAQNAICGIWGGYSRDTLIIGNRFEENGQAGGGLERGGINIEHGQRNTITDNSFIGNQVAVALWWDEDAHLAQTPWSKANGVESTGNIIANNRIEGGPLGIELRQCTETVAMNNSMAGLDTEMRVEGEQPRQAGEVLTPGAPSVEAIGETRPVGARSELAGRDKIVIGEFGPWDRTSLMLRLAKISNGTHEWYLYGTHGRNMVKYHVQGRPGISATSHGHIEKGGPMSIPVFAKNPGIYQYILVVGAGGGNRVTAQDTLLWTTWDVSFFPWAADPRENLDAWRAGASSPEAITTKLENLSFSYGGGAPRSVLPADADLPPGPGADRFGMIAKTRLVIPKGRWRFTTTSDDGVRVLVDGKPLIENWTWHGAADDSAILEMTEKREVEIVVEHFEIDGAAVLSFDIDYADTLVPSDSVQKVNVTDESGGSTINPRPGKQ